jgi:class 3 adenylate cyclase
LREFTRGPFAWFLSVVELTPQGTGTRLTHRVELEPRGLMGRMMAAFEIRFRTRRAMDRVYRRIDAALGGQPGDPFEEPPCLSRRRVQRLEQRLSELARRGGLDLQVVEALGVFLAEASDQDVSRIRPLALAERLGVAPDALVAACFHAVPVGLLTLHWDLLCPLCRVPSAVRDTLRLLREHEHCEACGRDFGLDLGNSVEATFRVHPEIREVETGTFCLGGPAHSPHVAAQVRVAGGERLELNLALPDGAYRLRGPQLPYQHDFVVAAGAGATHVDLDLKQGPTPATPHRLRPGGQVFVLSNGYAVEVVARLERTAGRGDALTAAKASSLALFRELFPEQVLEPGQLMSVSLMTLLAVDLADAERLYADRGDTGAFACVREYYRLVRQRVERDGGAVVRTVGEEVVAAFSDVAAAVRTALALQAEADRGEATRGLRLRIGVHRGPALTATLNEQLDYFGTTARLTLALPPLAGGGGVVLTEAVTSDPGVAALLRARRAAGELFTADLPGQAGMVLQRFG